MGISGVKVGKVCAINIAKGLCYGFFFHLKFLLSGGFSFPTVDTKYQSTRLNLTLCISNFILNECSHSVSKVSFF